MTDKEIFDARKEAKKKKRRQLDMLRFMQADVNRKLLSNSDAEDEDKVTLLRELQEIEIVMIETRRNKLGSYFYKFIPNKLKFDFKDVKKDNII